MTHQLEGPVSTAVAFVHAHCLVLVATLTGRLEAFHVAQDQSVIRQAWCICSQPQRGRLHETPSPFPHGSYLASPRTPPPLPWIIACSAPPPLSPPPMGSYLAPQWLTPHMLSRGSYLTPLMVDTPPGTQWVMPHTPRKDCPAVCSWTLGPPCCSCCFLQSYIQPSYLATSSDSGTLLPRHSLRPQGPQNFVFRHAWTSLLVVQGTSLEHKHAQQVWSLYVCTILLSPKLCLHSIAWCISRQTLRVLLPSIIHQLLLASLSISL